MNDTLNQKLFDLNDKLKPDVRDAILNIADDFVNSIEVGIRFPILDIILVGSNVGYNYTEESDLDVHIIVSYDDISNNDSLVADLFKAKRSLYNTNHDIKVKGIPVEIYTEDVATSVASNGIYSVINDRWEKKPIKESETTYKEVDKTSAEYKDTLKQIQDLLTNKRVTSEDITNFFDNLRLRRKYSIARDGEYGQFNLVFKSLRADGYFDRLRKHEQELKSDELSLEQLRQSSLEDIKRDRYDCIQKFNLYTKGLNGNRFVYSDDDVETIIVIDAPYNKVASYVRCFNNRFSVQFATKVDCVYFGDNEAKVHFKGGK